MYNELVYTSNWRKHIYVKINKNKGNKTGKNIIKEGGVYTYIYIHYVLWITVPFQLEKIKINRPLIRFNLLNIKCLQK